MSDFFSIMFVMVIVILALCGIVAAWVWFGMALADGRFLIPAFITAVLSTAALIAAIVVAADR